MPSVPSKWIADMMMKAMGKYAHKARVEGLNYLSDQFLCVRFQSEDFKSIEWIPGMEVEFRVDDTQFRHYTVRSLDNKAGHLDVLFFLHGNTPGCRWAKSLSIGGSTMVIGPAGKYLFDQTFTNYIFLGDETSMGLFLAFRDHLKPGTMYGGAIECSSNSVGLPHILGLECDVVKRKETLRGNGLDTWLSETFLDIRETLYYIAGHAATNKRLQRKLWEYGVPPKHIKVKAYWADGKKGL